MLPLWVLGVGVVGALASYVLVGLVARYGQQLALLDLPRDGEVQRRAVPRSGGYAMLVGLWLAVGFAFLGRPGNTAASPGDDWKLLGVMLGSIAIVPLAILDDRRRLGPLPQFVGQLTIASIPVAFGLRMGSLASPFGFSVELPIWVDVLFTIVWIVGMINAINWIDVMDGLAAGIATMAAVVLFTRSLWFEQYTIAVLPLALAGATLGFLPRNFHPARIFMGTSGSILLGYWLATTSVIGGAKVGTAFVVLGVPILDTAWVIVRRLQAGRSPFKGGDAEHLPHRIHALGLSQVQTVLVLYLICALFGFLSLTLHSPAEGPTLAKLFLLLGMVSVVALVLGTVTILGARRNKDADRGSSPGIMKPGGQVGDLPWQSPRSGSPSKSS
ncbi:MAG TPA: MraY family glycosyltransferase [Chloroflexota bacterium]|nr:MraY family glycosyltransferase [Chloroflexota bacterium]